MQFFLAVFYVLVGILLAAPYCYFAGWNVESFILAMVVAPLLFGVWLIVAGISSVIVANRNGRRIYLNWRAAFFKDASGRTSGKRLMFWLYTSWCLLPIIVRGVSVLAGSLGYEKLASVLYAHRYASMYHVFMGSLVLILVIVIATTLWESVRKKLVC